MSLSLIIFFLILITGILAAIFIDLYWGVCLYIALYFIFPVNRWWYTLPRFRYIFLVGVILIVCYLLKSGRYKDQTLVNFPQIKWLVLMAITMLIISFWAVWPEQHQKYTLIQIKQLLFLFVAYKVLDKYKKFEAVLWTYLAGCFYVSFLIFGVGRDTTGRVDGMGMPDGTDANMTAAVLITALPLLFAYFIREKGWRRLIPVFLFVFISNGIILLNSRGAMLGVFTSFMYLLGTLCFSKNSAMSGRQKLAIVVSFAGAFSLFLYFSDDVFWKRMSTLTHSNTEEIEGASRTYFWKKSYELAKKHPFGVGVDGFEYLSPYILEKKWLSKHTGTRAIHNTYFQALSDFGFPGIIILAGFILSSMRLMRKVKREIIRLRGDIQNYYLGTALESSFMAFLIAATFINRLYAEVFYWLMLFMACFANLNRKMLLKQTTPQTGTT